MEIPKERIDALQQREKSAGAPRSEREEMLNKFLDRMNPQRQKDGYPPLTYPRLAQLIGHIPTADLHFFYNECDRANKFGAMFYYLLKVMYKPEGAAPTKE